MSSLPEMLRSETKRQCGIERIKRFHLAVKPKLGIGAKGVSPADSGAQVAHAELSQPLDSAIQAWIFEVKPLADAHTGREVLEREFRGAILSDQAHVVKTGG